MAFEEIKENAEDLKEEARKLIDANVKYYKLWGFKICNEIYHYDAEVVSSGCHADDCYCIFFNCPCNRYRLLA